MYEFNKKNIKKHVCEVQMQNKTEELCKDSPTFMSMLSMSFLKDGESILLKTWVKLSVMFLKEGEEKVNATVEEIINTICIKIKYYCLHKWQTNLKKKKWLLLEKISKA